MRGYEQGGLPSCCYAASAGAAGILAGHRYLMTFNMLIRFQILCVLFVNLLSFRYVNFCKDSLQWQNKLYNTYGMEVTPMNLIAALLLSHLIGDFPLQTNQIYRLKSKSWLGIVLHSVVHVLVAALLIRQPFAVWSLLLWLGILHFLIDLTKLRLPIKQQWLSFLLDQVAHLVTLWLLAQLWSNATALLPMAVMLPLIAYGLFLATLVFCWVLANELSASQWGSRPSVQWARAHLLRLSQYAGVPLLLAAAAYVYQQLVRGA